jgi:predicted KAP-like P-loop ATPase
MSYEQQILRSLREVMSEGELISIKTQLLEDINKYEKNPNLVVVEQNLPKKNHDYSKSNFRGSKYRGPSKNRKKWQVMKMINKETVRIGAIKTELEAARIYDFLAILTEGLNVSIPTPFIIL